MKNEILEELKKIEEENNIKIIFASDTEAEHLVIQMKRVIMI